MASGIKSILETLTLETYILHIRMIVIFFLLFFHDQFFFKISIKLKNSKEIIHFTKFSQSFPFYYANIKTDGRRQ